MCVCGGANTTTPTAKEIKCSTHSGLAFLHLPDLVQNHVLDENRHGFQDERHEQMDVDVVPGAVQLPVGADTHTHTRS